MHTLLLRPVGLLLILVVLLAGELPRSARASPFHYDVVVVSGSSGGFAAAMAAGRMGANVALIEDTPVLGGMLSNGLSTIDTASCQSVSGIFDEFRRGVKEYYAPLVSGDPVFARSTKPKAPDEYLPIGWHWTQCTDPREGGSWEPHVADRILKQMIRKVPSIHVFYNTYATGVIMNGNRIVGVVTRNKNRVVEKVFGRAVIDATPEGDIAAWSGVPYRVGREARSRLEPHAGQIYFLDETGEIMPGSTGQEDSGVPSYGLRLTAKIYSKKDAPAPSIVKPQGYRQVDYAGAGCWKKVRASMPHDKFEINANPIGNEMQGINWAWPEAGQAQRQRLYDIYKNHALGFLYFQQHDCGLRQIGLPQDEFADNGHIPYRLYVREGRRIRGIVTMTETDINPFIGGHGLIPPLRTDSISTGYYPIDSKPVRPKTDVTRPDKGDGDFFLVNAASAFQVPYGAIVPEKIDGLLVPGALSATHVAYSAIRMEPTLMEIGQAAGTAAALSVRNGVEVREVSLEALQRELIRQKCRLAFYWDVSLADSSFAAIQWLSVKGIIEGGRDRFFRPSGPLTRAEMASWIVKMLRLWPSVSNVHFTDVPYDVQGFRDIETLFDNNLLIAFGIEPMWQKLGGFNPVRNVGLAQGHGIFGQFHPTEPVLWRELVAVLKSAASHGDGLMKSGDVPYTVADVEKVFGDMDVSADRPVTRGQAAFMLCRLLEQNLPSRLSRLYPVARRSGEQLGRAAREGAGPSARQP